MVIHVADNLARGDSGFPAVARLKTPAGAYQAYLSTLAAVEEEAGVKTLLVNNVLGFDGCRRGTVLSGS